MNVLLADVTRHSLTVKLGVIVLLEEIYELRSYLNELSLAVGNLTSPNLIAVSQKLDRKLNDYEQLKSKMNIQVDRRSQLSS